jgi:hypothetical protein
MVSVARENQTKSKQKYLPAVTISNKNKKMRDATNDKSFFVKCYVIGLWVVNIKFVNHAQAFVAKIMHVCFFVVCGIP